MIKSHMMFYKRSPKSNLPLKPQKPMEHPHSIIFHSYSIHIPSFSHLIPIHSPMKNRPFHPPEPPSTFSTIPAKLRSSSEALGSSRMAVAEGARHSARHSVATGWAPSVAKGRFPPALGDLRMGTAFCWELDGIGDRPFQSRPNQ